MDWIYLIITFGVSLWYMEHVKKDGTKPKDEPLVNKERFVVPILCLLNPIIGGLSFYYGWKGAFPKKAQQANHWSLGFLYSGLPVQLSWIQESADYSFNV